MAKFQLDGKTVTTLSEKGWVVTPEGFQIILYADEYRESEWESICEIAGVPASRSEVTILGFGVK